ncbi:aspartate/glutamate racemase family protein [Selenomonas sp. FC4001]|uniref:aspartate/glutamate racemase family protein n=1 Tax=Selenomonas sp. FC4001 TaxID=1408313 RepID=UPI00055C7FDB|nr:amino acid racemase [Selenomonas sp. FC4001]
MKLGILGGFGGYATIDFFRRLLERFSLDTERSYPHVIMDNNFSMPSRTKALLTGEGWDEIVDAIAHSIRMMLSENVDAIVLVCGTAHAFLPDVYRKVPKAKEKVVSIIDALGEKLKNDKINQVLVIAAEGALHRKIYTKKLKKMGIEAVEPAESEWKEIRKYIEAVKKNNYSDEMAEEYLRFIRRYGEKNIVLGCTEFPALVNEYKKRDPFYGDEFIFYDPLETVLANLEEISNMKKQS